MNLLGIPRSKISYLNRLSQDLSIAEQLHLDSEAELIRDKIQKYKNKQQQGRADRKEARNAQE